MWLEVQKTLNSMGFNAGPEDGIPGPLTKGGIKKFQVSKGLNPTGNLDVNTLKALNLFNTEVPDWYAYAQTLLGTNEIRGPKSNPTIMTWAQKLRLDNIFTNDDIPWCGLFVAHVMSTTHPDEPMPSNVLGAQQWKKYGVEAPQPSLGDILSFWRGSPSSWKGHVGFYAGESPTAYKVLGGNQSNTVNYTWISKNRLISARRPTNSIYETKPVLYTANGRLSTNEA